VGISTAISISRVSVLTRDKKNANCIISVTYTRWQISLCLRAVSAEKIAILHADSSLGVKSFPLFKSSRRGINLGRQGWGVPTRFWSGRRVCSSAQTFRLNLLSFGSTIVSFHRHITITTHQIRSKYG